MTQTAIRSTNPARPDEVLVEVPAAGPHDVAKAAEAARAAQRDWQAQPPTARSAALSAAADAVAAASDELHLADGARGRQAAR